MDLTHTFHVPSDLDATWAHFQDVAGLAGCFPGATVSAADENGFTGSCKVKLGPIALVYNGTGTFTARDEDAHRLVVEAKGRDKRGNGTAAATATLTMAAASGGGTDVEVLTDLTITGKPAQFGRGLIQEVSDKLLGQFVTCLEQQLSAPAAAPPADAPPVVADPAPAEAQSAAAAPAAPSVAASAAVESGGGGRIVGPRVSSSPGQDDALDLGATVLPVLVRSYWKPALAVVVVLTVLLRLLRRRG